MQIFTSVTSTINCQHAINNIAARRDSKSPRAWSQECTVLQVCKISLIAMIAGPDPCCAGKQPEYQLAQLSITASWTVHEICQMQNQGQQGKDKQVPKGVPAGSWGGSMAFSMIMGKKTPISAFRECLNLAMRVRKMLQERAKA